MALESNVPGFFIGDAIALVYTIYAPGTTEAHIEAGTASVQDVTGWALEWVLRLTRWSTTAVVTKTTASGITLTNPTSGIVTVTVARAISLLLTPRVYHKALRRTDAGSEVMLSYGTCPLRQA